MLVEDPGERWARPLCFDCADDVIDRMNAHGEHPEAAEMILKAREEIVYRPLPAPRINWETADHTKLNALRAQWRAFEGTLTDASRCWAALPNGTQCVRREHEAGLCETHLIQGCDVPGLGWAGGEPRGRMVARRGRRAA